MLCAALAILAIFFFIAAFIMWDDDEIRDAIGYALIGAVFAGTCIYFIGFNLRHFEEVNTVSGDALSIEVLEDKVLVFALDVTGKKITFKEFDLSDTELIIEGDIFYWEVETSRFGSHWISFYARTYKNTIHVPPEVLLYDLLQQIVSEKPD